MSLATASSPTYDVPLPSADASLRLESWYHGAITRIRSESLVRAEGDFLVRDSISSKGDFVLTAYWKGKAIHFQINKTASKNSSTSFLYQFEDEQFESVSDLILFYQSHRRAVTVTSGCIIMNPVPKTAVRNQLEPLHEIEQNYATIFRSQPNKNGFDRSLSQQVLLNETRKLLLSHPTSHSATNLNNEKYKDQKPPIGKKQHYSLSALLNRPLPVPEKTPVEEDQEEYCEMDYDTMEGAADDVLDASTSSLVRKLDHASLTSLNNMKTAPLISSSSQSCQDVSKLHWRLPRTDSAPSLPARRESIPVRDSGCVPDTSDYDQPRSSVCTRPPSIIDIRAYRSPYIEPENLPQTKELVSRFRNLLLKQGPKKCAKLITQEDCRLLRFHDNVSQSSTSNPNGITYLLLPNGLNIRNDLIERSRSLQFACVLSILNLEKSESDSVLWMWIRIARSLLYDFGNLFSFLTIMSALCCKPLVSASAVWNGLEISVLQEFQTKLLPAAETLRMTGCTPESSAPTTIPLLQPLLDLLSTAPSSSFLDTSSFPAQIESLWKWLEMGREWSMHAEKYQRLAIERRGDSVAVEENFLSTEFLMKFLFGTKGCAVAPKLRYQKLAEVVNVLSERASL